MINKRLGLNIVFLIFLIFGNALLLTPEGSLLRVIGSVVLFLLPGLSWAESLALGSNRLLRWTVGLGLSYAIITIMGLILYYLPGPINLWSVLLPINLLTIGAIIAQFFTEGSTNEPLPRKLLILILLVLSYGAVFRLVSLEYSEFQGDETRVMVPAAEALEGDPDILFDVGKRGPGQILIPMVFWRMTGIANEFSARLPFAIAGLLAILTAYLLGSSLFGEKTGLLSAALIAANGFMVAFSRIVQYQQIVIWMSLLALLSGWEWQKQQRTRWAILAGVFVGVGVLAHYDTILVLPALVYLFVSKSTPITSRSKGLLVAVFWLVITAGVFFVPFLLHPELTETEDYLVRRIGQDLIKNSLDNFFYFSIFYNSFYYILFTGLLVVGFLSWTVTNLGGAKRSSAVRYLLVIIAAILVVAVISLSLRPDLFRVAGLDWAFLPFSLIFIGAFLSSSANLAQRTIILWLATAFLGYNFAVADPATHIYTVYPAWVFLAGLMMARIWDWGAVRRTYIYFVTICCIFITVLFSGYLYVAFLRQDVEFISDWPDSLPTFYWYPYEDLPGDGWFGFVHKEGWKSIGGLYAADRIIGEYQTNGKYGAAAWYIPDQFLGCYHQSKNFFALKGRVIDPIRFADYALVGEVELPYGRGMNILQMPPGSHLGPVTTANEERFFDQTAEPAAFVGPVTETGLAGKNLADYVELVKYDVANTQAQPGEQIRVLLYWQLRQDIHVDLDVFVHFESVEENGSAIWGQSNGNPACGEYPTSMWEVGEVVNDLHILTIDPETPPGNYRISTGMYLPENNQRLPLFDENGQPMADSIELTTLSMQ